ncbi:MAG: glycosyltransferase family 2 protein [Alloprevotella sp.]
MEPPLPKITVATVTYNAEALIQRTIESVEAQTYRHIEHLIIDGNSQDETLALVHHYQERNSRAAVPHEIICRSEPDRGLYDAMNKALQLATGRYIVFLNAGDCFHDTEVVARIAAAAAPQAGKWPAVVYGRTNLVDADGRFVRERRLTPPERLTWRDFRSGMLVCHQAFFAAVDLAKETPYDMSFRFSADFDWCIRIMQAGERQGRPVVNGGLVVCDYLAEGMTTRHRRASLFERFRIMSRHYGLFPTLGRHLWFVVRLFTKR